MERFIASLICNLFMVNIWMNDFEYLGNLMAMTMYLRPQGLESYIVVFEDNFKMQFWAESPQHAYEQGESAEPELAILEVYPEFKVIYQRSNPNASWNLPK